MKEKDDRVKKKQNKTKQNKSIHLLSVRERRQECMSIELDKG